MQIRHKVVNKRKVAKDGGLLLSQCADVDKGSVINEMMSDKEDPNKLKQECAQLKRY